MQNGSYREMRTERLFLRTLTEADVKVVRNFFQQEEEFETNQAALAWIRRINKRRDMQVIGGAVNFYVWLLDTDQFIGRVYIHKKAELDGEVEIGYGISGEYRNKGYATEAAKALVRFAFEQVGLGELCAIVRPENTASRRVIEKLGFSYCGIRTVADIGADWAYDYFRLSRDDFLSW